MLGISPALLVVSKTLYEEAFKVLYGLNTYHIQVVLDVQYAQKWAEVHRTLQSLHLPPDFDPPELDLSESL